MGKTSRSRASVQTRGVAESRLRTEQKQADHGGHDPQALLSKDTVRGFLEAFMCPWCDRGPFKVVAVHVSRMHGVGPKELRDLAGLCYNETLTEPETHARRSAAGRARDMSLVRAAARPEHFANSQYSKAVTKRREIGKQKRSLSEAAKEMNRRKLADIKGVGTIAAASASKVAAEIRYELAKPSIQVAYESRQPFSEVALELGVSTAQVGRWARRMGLPDGRTLAAQWREFQPDALRAGSELALERARERDSSDWVGSDQSWEHIAVMAEARGISEKSMRARLRSLGHDIGNGHTRADRRKRTNFPAKRMACDVSECTREHVARGLCRYHYQKWREENGKVPICAVDKCSSFVVARGMCAAHYYQATK